MKKSPRLTANPFLTDRPTVTTYLCIRRAGDALDFYKAAFGAEEIERFVEQGGRVGHSEIMIGGTFLMIAGEFPQMSMMGVDSPSSLGGSSAHFFAWVKELRPLIQSAVKAGATLMADEEADPEGGRRCRLLDPFGFLWTFRTRKKARTPAGSVERSRDSKRTRK